MEKSSGQEINVVISDVVIPNVVISKVYCTAETCKYHIHSDNVQKDTVVGDGEACILTTVVQAGRSRFMGIIWWSLCYTL